VTTEGPRFSEGTLAEYRALLTRYPQRRAALMPILWLAQREFGWLSLPVMEYVATLMELPLAWVTSVASFYTMYWKEPKGRWHIQLCRNLRARCAGQGRSRWPSSAASASATASEPPTAASPSRRSSVWRPAGRHPVLQVNNTEYHENLTVARRSS